MSTALVETEIEYPEEDGEPLAETQAHLDAMLLLRQALEDFFHPRKDVFISTDQFWYWKEGQPKECFALDLMVCLGVPVKTIAERGSYKMWEENDMVPSIIFEMASKGTWKDDLGKKYRKYAELGVREYFLFDPLAEYLVPNLQGYRLDGTSYRQIHPDENEVFETELGFKLTVDGEMIRLIRTSTGHQILTRREQVEFAEERLEAEKQRADEMAAQVAKLQALLAQHNIPTGKDP